MDDNAGFERNDARRICGDASLIQQQPHHAARAHPISNCGSPTQRIHSESSMRVRFPRMIRSVVTVVSVGVFGAAYPIERIAQPAAYAVFEQLAKLVDAKMGEYHVPGVAMGV